MGKFAKCQELTHLYDPLDTKKSHSHHQPHRYQVNMTHNPMEKVPNSIATQVHNPHVLNHSELMAASAKRSKPKRRNIRPPQKPGLTVQGKVRHFVEHKYTDRANERVEVEHAQVFLSSGSFPLKLYKMLSEVESLGLGHAVSWFPHGRAFAVFDIHTFTEQIMPTYFSQTKWTSFLRQLSLYGFTRLSKDPDRGGYYHENFLRGRPLLASKLIRSKIKGTKFKATSSPETEPNFYAMPFVTDPAAASTADPSLNLVANHSSIVNPQKEEKSAAKKQKSKKMVSDSLPTESGRNGVSSLTMQRNPPIVGQFPGNRAGTMNPNLVSTLNPYGQHLQNPRLLSHPNHSFLSMQIPSPMDRMPLNDGQPKVARDLSFPHVPYLTANNSIPLDRTLDIRAFANNMDTSSSNPLGRHYNDSRLLVHSNFPSVMVQKPNMMERVSDDCAGSSSSDYTPGPFGDDPKYSKDSNSLEDRVVNNSTQRQGHADDRAHSSSADNTPNPGWDHSDQITQDARDVSHWKQMVQELEDENFRLKMRSSSLFRLCQDLKEENQLLKRGVQYENVNSNASLRHGMSSNNYGMRY